MQKEYTKEIRREDGSEKGRKQKEVIIRRDDVRASAKSTLDVYRFYRQIEKEIIFWNTIVVFFNLLESSSVNPIRRRFR